jgi:uncharacterized protein involved in exopolysaccharide biosynthesis
VDLKARLTELRAVYGQEHPAVVQQEAQIKAASEPPAELVELQKIRSALLIEIKGVPEDNAKQGSNELRASNRSVGAVRVRSAAARPNYLGLGEDRQDPDEDPAVTAARAGLNRALEKYGQVTERLASARLQFTTSQVAFNGRLIVTGEPEVPRKPMKPLQLVLSMATVVLSLLFGLLAGALRELASGKIHEPWQVKLFGLKTLGELCVPERLEQNNATSEA